MPEPNSQSLLVDNAPRGYFAVDPNGNKISLTRELFDALKLFLRNDEKPNGSLVAQFKQGGVAGVKIERTYK